MKNNELEMENWKETNPMKPTAIDICKKCGKKLLPKETGVTPCHNGYLCSECFFGKPQPTAIDICQCCKGEHKDCPVCNGTGKYPHETAGAEIVKNGAAADLLAERELSRNPLQLEDHIEDLRDMVQSPASDEKLDKINKFVEHYFVCQQEQAKCKMALLDYTAQLRSEIVELAELNRNAVAGNESLKQQLESVLGSPSLRVSAEIAKARQSEIESLQKQLADAKRDSDRLDWMQDNYQGVETYPKDDPDGEPTLRHWIVENVGIENIRATIREAIDAMKEGK